MDTGQVKIDIDARGVARVTLDRAEVHNAFDDTLIAELTGALHKIESDGAVRAVILAGNGRSFSAGADLQWMKRMADYSPEENLRDARGLASLMHTLYRLEKPTVARVHGSAFGGGVGLVACCDIAVCVPESLFSLSEVRLGLTPSVISPYVVAAMGERHARRYFLTAERFDAAEALRCGLVHQVVAAGELDAAVERLVTQLLAGGPEAQRDAKDLICRVGRGPIDDAMVEDTAGRIARIRARPEGREGVRAFLEKRPAAWIDKT